MSGFDRLPTHLEVSGLIRATEAQGGHAAVLHKGDPDRGTLILFILSRGQPVARYERVLGLDGAYSWAESAPSEASDSQKVAEFLAKRARFDPDFWAIELDIPAPERFIAENLRAG